jgi:hypothetical protein
VTERLRAPLAALVALLIGGELAARGLDVFTDVWGWLFPYLWLFLIFEVLGARRRLLDAEAFLVGAAVGLLHGGVYAKTLQEGGLPFGVDALGAVVSAFDWGMVAVLSLHVADAVLPRRGREDGARLEAAAAAAIAAGAAGVYFVMTATGRYRYERMIGSWWLAADALFAAAAAALVRRALRRAAEEEAPERDRWLWALAAFCAWLPGAQILSRAAGDPTGFVALFLLLVWTVVFGFVAWRSWADRGYVDAAPLRASRPLLGVALWRLLALAALAVAFGRGGGDDDGRAAGAYQIFVDLPSRLAFAWIFFSSRAAV